MLISGPIEQRFLIIRTVNALELVQNLRILPIFKLNHTFRKPVHILTICNFVLQDVKMPYYFDILATIECYLLLVSSYMSEI